jgi:hypothetical protein
LLHNSIVPSKWVAYVVRFPELSALSLFVAAHR